MSFSIALDGPAGAGKSTIAKSIAKKLGITYLDTGAMYRTVALKAIRSNVDTKDESGLEKLLENIKIDITHVEQEQRIFLDGEDVSDKIRTPQVSMGASEVATIPAVRIKMVDLQRKIAENKSVIMDGRDIGTYVLPNADLKIYLTASVEERARRRYEEMKEKGMETSSLKEVEAEIAARDRQDSSRSFAPLKKAQDAIEIDSTNLQPEQVVERVEELLKGVVQ